MKNRRNIVLAAAFLAVGALSVSQAAVDFARQDDRAPPEVPSLPRPISSPEETTFTPTAVPATFQLIGFTQETFTGTRGALNHALACQREFSNSRICSAEDIRNSVVVPEPPGTGYAWVDVRPSQVSEGFSTRSPRTEDEVSNCRGWKSSSTTDYGVAMDLSNTYGAMVRRSCDQSLAVACCAMLQSSCR